jgi:hypothetical protein
VGGSSSRCGKPTLRTNYGTFKGAIREWNEIALEVKKAVDPLVMRKIEDVTREHNLPKVFHNRVRWDIMHLCMEAEYADLCSPAFYAGISYFYVNGHFTCGWSGEYPEGMLVIY